MGTIRESVESIELRGSFGNVLHLVELKNNNEKYYPFKLLLSFTLDNQK
jgi:hypothetical protein